MWTIIRVFSALKKTNGNRFKAIRYKKGPWVTDVDKSFSLAFFEVNGLRISRWTNMEFKRCLSTVVREELKYLWS